MGLALPIRRWPSLLVILIFLSWTSSAQPVVINEYSCSNFNGPTDPYGQREDWVELYNTTSAAISLSGYWLSDKVSNIQNWQIPVGVSIPAGGRMRVFCNDRGTFNGGALNPSFKLTQCRPEQFVLATPNGTIVDSVTLRRTQANHSRGRTTDGASTWALFDTPTLNAANTGAKTEYVDKVSMSIAPGFYTSTQSVALSTPFAGATIRYTLDGSTPTAASAVYTAPLSVASTTVVRARAFSSNAQYLPSFTETNTYFINETVAPTMNVVSVSGPFTTFFQNGQRIFNAYEFFDKSKQFKFDLEGETRRHGNDSWAYAQKGMRFYARDGLGHRASMDYKFFNTSSRDTFNVVIMKAAGSDNYPAGPNPSAHLRDIFSHTLAEKFEMDVDGRRYEPTVLYVNGQYWGIYELRERVDGDYTEYNYGQPEDKIDMLRYWGTLNVEAGSDTGWVNLYNYVMANNMAVPANYAHVKQFLKPESLIDYFILNTYLVNSDWLNWNSMWWRGRKGQGVRWRYALWDQDNTMGLGQNYTGMGTTGPQNNPCEPFNLFPNAGPNIGHSAIINKLMSNADFSKLYRDRFILALNGPLACPNMHTQLDSLVAILQPEMQRQITRWGGTMPDWQNNIANIRTWINTRCAVIAQKLDSCMKLKPAELIVNTSPPGVGTVALDGTTLNPVPWRRIMMADSPYTLKATPTQPYWTFDHWKNFKAANTWLPDSLTDQVIFSFREKDSVVAVFRYFNTDSISVTFTVDTPGNGTIELEGMPLPLYPYTVTLDRRYSYELKAEPTTGYSFENWSKLRDSTFITPTLTSALVNFRYRSADTLTAHFSKIPPPPPVPPIPPVPPLVPLELGMMLPTAFSPNGDGLNDFFGVTGSKDLRQIDLRIYNRWGETVFTARSPYSRWDGMSKGVACEPGVYYYVLTVEWSNPQQHKNKTVKGEVTLIR